MLDASRIEHVRETGANFANPRLQSSIIATVTERFDISGTPMVLAWLLADLTAAIPAGDE